MKLYDISKEIFSAPVYPGDPKPEKKPVYCTAAGDPCNLQLLCLGSHTGTHMDAPWHFEEQGRTVEQIGLEQTMGDCAVVQACGVADEDWLAAHVPAGCERLLLKGSFTLTPEGASYLARCGLRLYGVEAMSVGEGEDGLRIHHILLGADMVILESLELSKVPEGSYFLCAAPLKLAGLDGAPCRACLIDWEDGRKAAGNLANVL